MAHNLDIKQLPLIFHNQKWIDVNNSSEIIPNKLIEVNAYQTTKHTVVPIMKPISKVFDYEKDRQK
jgi:hypothetical protein